MKVLSVAALTLVASLAFADSTPRAPVTPGKMVASLRRLTESQYRNSIADIFGPDIAINGRFEPILRPVHELIATGANDAAVSPAGLEQFDAMARGIAAQVFDDAHRAAFMDCAPKRLPQPDDACARATLLPLGRYLFRRPLTQSCTSALRPMRPPAPAPSMAACSWRWRRCWCRRIFSTWWNPPSPTRLSRDFCGSTTMRVPRASASCCGTPRRTMRC
jgi:Protein of unknown function (DUF1587)